MKIENIVSIIGIIFVIIVALLFTYHMFFGYENMTNTSNNLYTYVGAFNDQGQRAFPSQLSDVQTIDQCYQQAKNENFDTFALQNGSQCFVGNKPSYDKYGSNSSCTSDMGCGWVNQVYKINPPAPVPSPAPSPAPSPPSPAPSPAHVPAPAHVTTSLLNNEKYTLPLWKTENNPSRILGKDMNLPKCKKPNALIAMCEYPQTMVGQIDICGNKYPICR